MVPGIHSLNKIGSDLLHVVFFYSLFFNSQVVIYCFTYILGKHLKVKHTSVQYKVLLLY